MFKHIVCIHGYTGEHGHNPNSSKIEHLRNYAAQGGYVLHTPHYPDHDPEEAHKFLTDYVNKVKKKDPHAVLVGTSMGGYWAHRLSNEHKLPSVIVNPATEPYVTLGRHVKAGRMTQSSLNRYKKLIDHHSAPSTVHEPRMVLLEKGDTMIDPNRTAKAYKGHADVRMFEGGNHQFSRHNEISNALSEIQNTVTGHMNHA